MTKVGDSNKANMYLWYQALKSGKYPQVNGMLARRLHFEAEGVPANKMSFCCLGVACEVAVSNGIALKVTAVDVDGNTVNYPRADDIYAPSVYEVAYDGTQATLPEAVRQWLGLDEEDPHLASLDGLADDQECGDFCGCHVVTATRANDKLKLSFSEIADGIYHSYGLSEVGPEINPEVARG